MKTPQGNRWHIGIFGRRNAGKSSLVNALAGQTVSLVSDLPGTTTDPVRKAMEMPRVGPVVLVDTAGLDDAGPLGDMRVRRTRQVLEQTDLALVVVRAGQRDLDDELEWAGSLSGRGTPVIVVANVSEEDGVDLEPEADRLSRLFRHPVCLVNARTGWNVPVLIRMIGELADRMPRGDFLLDGVVGEGDTVLLVMPQDEQAPKGRLILPQVQVIRELLDRRAIGVTTVPELLPAALRALQRKPDLVIADSRVFRRVNALVPAEVPLTSFSILFARNKGDLAVFREGAETIDRLNPGDSVLIAEACTHHAAKGDISRERLPGWLMERVGGPLNIEVKSGADFPEQLSAYRLIIHCGGCMTNRRQVLARIGLAREAGVPITNHGMAIAKLSGILDRAMTPFEKLEGSG